jgi:hypothetical protein
MEGYPGSVIVPAVYGRTAAASLKSSSARVAPNRDEALGASMSRTLRLIELATALAHELGLVARETPSGVSVKTRESAPVAHVYPARWDCLGIPIQSLRDRGWASEAEAIGAELQSLTSKRLTPKSPRLPSLDAVAGWETVRGVITRIARLYSPTER